MQPPFVHPPQRAVLSRNSANEIAFGQVTISPPFPGLPPESSVPVEPESALGTFENLEQEVAECHRLLEEAAGREEEANRERQIFEAVTDHVSDFLVLLDLAAQREWVNPAFQKALGYAAEELAGSSAFSGVHPDDMRQAEAALTQAGARRQAQEVELRMRRQNGDWLWLQAQVIPLLNGEGEPEGFVFVAHDVSETHQRDSALAVVSTQVDSARLSEKMARDFDQILTNAFGNLTIAKNLNGAHNALSIRLNEIERSLKKARDLTEQMLSLAPGTDRPRTRIALEPVAQEAASAVLRGTMVRAEYVFPRNLPEVEVDVEALSHALRNLITNSIQAMDRGMIRLTAELVSPEVLQRRPEVGLPLGTYLALVIQDQGHGMSERVRQRAFEPYFTTRQGSQGLGLTTALSTVQKLGGTIVLESTPSVGTSAEIYLPVAPSGSEAAPVLPKKISQSLSGTPRADGQPAQRILLMDDEQMILDIVSRMLTHLGYEVRTCTDGSQAIAAYAKAKAQGVPFDLVLMDLIIPNGVGGQDAVHTIRKINPEARVVASSGHLDHPVMVAAAAHGFSAVLEKPYKLEKLQQVIETALAGVSP